MIEIVAEAGLNHNGDLDLAKRMVDAAMIARANIVKFQTYDPDAILHQKSDDYKLLSSLALSRSDFIKLAKHCETMGVEFMSTPGDVDSLTFLVEEVGVKRLKIGSDDLGYKPLTDAALATGLPLIISTGMSYMSEIAQALSGRTHDITLLHCVSVYPCSFSEANLLAMNTLKDNFGVRVGYSDHTKGYLACIAAAAMGAKVIEKHFMLDARSICVDKVVSISSIDLIEMVKQIRTIESMMGDGIKVPCAAEMVNAARFRKGADGKRGILV